MLVNCQFCGKKVEKSQAVRYNDKNFHEECLKQYLDKKELIDYICKTFGFKANKPGPRIYSQIKMFTEKNGYSYKDMYNALVYFYDIKKNPIKEENKGTIGIIPYVIDESREYFKKMDNLKKHIEVNLIKNEKNVAIIKVNPGPKNGKRKLIIDLNSILKEDEF